MRLVVARCSVDYRGKLAAHLPLATRLLLIKADGSVSVHSDDRAYKPLNWMSPPCRLVQELEPTAVAPGVWRVANRAGEELVVTVEEVLHDSEHPLGAEPGLVKDGVEADLQKLLAARVDVLGAGWRLVSREFATAIGPVDLLVRDDTGAAVAVEVKRRAEIDGLSQALSTASQPVTRPRHLAVEVKRRATIQAVEQLTRYLELLNRDSTLAPVGGVLAAQSIAPQAKTLAHDRGIRCLLLDLSALRQKSPEGNATLF